MGWSVVSVASGGMPVTDVTATTGRGTPVSEATNMFGRAVTKVASSGMAVAYETIGIAPAVVPTTLNGTPTAGVVMSNGNLTAVHGTINANMGVNSTSFLGTGKYYFEMTLQAWGTASTRLGIILSTGAYSNTAGSNNVVTVLGTGNSTIFSNGGSTVYTLGAAAAGNVFGVAIDLNARLAWLRKSGGLWNGNASADPVTGVNGVIIPAGTWAPYIHFGGGTSASATDQVTANFGQSAFANAAPAGFGNWPA